MAKETQTQTIEGHKQTQPVVWRVFSDKEKQALSQQRQDVIDFLVVGRCRQLERESQRLKTQQESHSDVWKRIVRIIGAKGKSEKSK